MDRKFVVILILTFLLSGCMLNEETEISSYIKKNGDELVVDVFENAEKYEFQMIYTDVNRDEEGNISLDHHSLYLDTTRYFYPASTVKMPVAFLAFQRIKELREHHPQLSIHTPMYIDTARISQSMMDVDSCSSSGKPTVASLADQIFAISDNNAYNRLYEFLGQEYINKELHDKDIFSNSRIITRVGVGGFDREENKYVNPITFLDNAGDTVLHIEDRYSEYKIPENHSLRETQKGTGYVSGDSIIRQPFDMSEKNFINLVDLHNSLIHFIYPELFLPHQRYNMSEETRNYLMQSMEKLPHDFDCYQENENYYDSYVKFFMFGDSKDPIPDHIIIRNKVGFAYGYLTDVAHIKDMHNDIEFYLSATIHVNENKIYNDGVYEYEDIGIPFLAKLGRLVYNYEMQ